MLPIAVGIGAGLATALLFAAFATATPLALPLFMLSPLPVAIASLGWGWVSGGIGVLVSGLVLGGALAAVSSNPIIGIVLSVTFALPVVWLAHLATLSRPARAEEPEGAREWVSYGQILVHALFLVVGLLILGGAALGFEPSALIEGTTEALEAWVASQASGGLVRPEDVPAVAALAVSLMPYMAASLTLLMLVFSLWLGARIAAGSGLLPRPLAPFHDAQLPAWMAGVFALAILGTFAPYPLGTAAAVLMGASVMAFTLTGLAAIHTVTLGHPARGAILAGVYVAGFVFGFPVLMVVVLGVADSLLNLRARFRRAPPPDR
ncbi:MAG: DUF2232 domain-containing protein [Bauldia sp.]|nr:DUF2232 domain-containing protein [Bauldia sp.]